MASSLVISLDFELLWGVKDHRTIESYGKAISGGREAVLAILSLFEEEQIHATWATVGMLACSSKKDLLNYCSGKNFPCYENEKLSNYDSINQIGENEIEDSYHFGKSLVDKILKTRFQEFASHTFSHYYCLEQGQTKDDFEEDVVIFKQLCQDLQTKVESIVFPRNQYNKEYLSVLFKHGFTCFRGNESHWLYEAKSRAQESNWRKLVRLVDGYINYSGYHSYKLNDLKKEEGLLNIPASRFFRPYSSKLSFIEGLKIRRIKASMKHAAMEGEIFHLWWHPHNFGIHRNEMMKQLVELVSYYKQLKEQYGMQSMTMSEVRKKYDKYEI